MDVFHILHSFRLLLFKFFEVLSDWSEAVIDVVFVSVTSLEEKDADKVDERGVNRLQDLLEDKFVVGLLDVAAHDEVS